MYVLPHSGLFVVRFLSFRDAMMFGALNTNPQSTSSNNKEGKTLTNVSAYRLSLDAR